MHEICKRALSACALAITVFSGSAATAAPAWPSRPITIIVPFTPGGLSDVAARKLGHAIEAELKQPVIVENRPGAGGVVGTEVAARARADGYTLLVTGPHHIINQAIRPKLPYDAIKDFTPVAVLISSPLMLAVANNLPVTTLSEYIAHAKTLKGGMSYGSSGVGGTSHMAGAIFELETNAPMAHIPYKGTTPVLQDLLGGQLASVFLDEASLAPLIQDNKIRPIAITANRRSEVFPNVPSTSELGFPKVDVLTWMGFYVPVGTPEAIVRQLNAIAVKGMGSPQQKAWLRQNGATAGTMDAEQTRKFTLEELTKWQRVAREASIKAE